MTNVYGDLLSRPGAGWFVAAGLAGRLAHLTTVLSTVLLLASTTGRYATAGLVAAGYPLAYGVAGPVTGRLVDRYRQGPVLVVTTVANTVARAAFLVVAEGRAPAWVLLGFSVLSGATMPAVGPLVRARWRYLLADSGQLHAALSLESIADDLVLVVSPVLATGLASAVDPAAGLVVALGCGLAGQGALAMQRRTEPPVEKRTQANTPLRLWRLAVVFVGIGAATTTVDITIIAYTQHSGRPALGGWILGTVAAASAASGLWYGARYRPTRLVPSVGLLAGAVALFVAVPSWGFLFVTAGLLGLTLAPVMISGFARAVAQVPRHRLTEAFTWLTTAMGLGITIGSTLGGRVVDGWGTRAAFAAAAGCAVVAVFSAMPVRRAVRRRPCPPGTRTRR